MMIRHKQRNTVNTRTICRAAVKCNIKKALVVSLETALTNLSNTWKDYKRLKKDAYRLRYEFPCDYESNAETSKAKNTIKMIRMHEESRRFWRAIAKNQGKVTNKGIFFIQVKEYNV